MSGQLFGDIELGKSFGISANVKIKYAKPRTILYASGTSINSFELLKSKESTPETPVTPVAASTPATGAAPSKAVKEAVKEEIRENTPITLLDISTSDCHGKVLVGDNQISAFTFLAKESIIAYAEISKSYVKLAKWIPASGMIAQTTMLHVSDDLSIKALDFSADGLYLASLGDLPHHQITIWGWKTQKKLIVVPNGCPANMISFNPLDSKQLCTTGANGKINFWKLKAGFKSHRLQCTQGCRNLNENPATKGAVLLNPWHLDFDDKSPSAEIATPENHIWAPDRKVLSLSSNGKRLYKYNADSGVFTVLIDLTGTNRTMTAVLLNIKNIIVSENGGILSIFSLDGEFYRSHQIHDSPDIVSLKYSPDYQKILIETRNRNFYICDLKKLQSVLIKSELLTNVIGMDMIVHEKALVTAHKDGELVFWVPEKMTEFQRLTVKANITCISVGFVFPIMAVGSNTGVVRLYSAKDLSYRVPKLLFRKKTHKSPVLKFSINSEGTMMASAADDGQIVLYDLEKCSVVGILFITGTFQSMRWEICEEATQSRIYVLHQELGETSSSISVFDLPEKGQLDIGPEYDIQKDGYPLPASHRFIMSYQANDFVVAPKPTLSSKNNFFIMGADGQMKIISNSSHIGAGQRSTVAAPLFDIAEHTGHFSNLYTNSNGEWILSASSDGFITLRSLIEPEKSTRFSAHDPNSGGVLGCVFSYNYRNLISIGNDGIYRRWDWKYSSFGKRAAAELAEALDKMELAMTNIEVVNPIEKILEVSEIQDSPSEPLFSGLASRVEASPIANSEKSEEGNAFRSKIQEKVASINKRILAIYHENENAPVLERIDHSEFVIDLEEKKRLSEETEKMIKIIRQKQEQKNTEKRVLRNRIKEECWDSAQVVGQSIKSFKSNTMLGRILEVTNYPIRKLSTEENRLISNVKRFRRVQLAVAATFEQTGEQVEGQENTSNGLFQSNDGILKTQIKGSQSSKLLYHPFQLSTKERHRTQYFILSECIQEIKMNFNAKFQENVKAKQDEISKIEEKNDRISSILAQLQISENIVHPELDDDEVPENIINVSDSEIKVKRYLTAEEQAAIEAKRLQAEARLRRNGDDNSRQRALIDMMNGKLEDRKMKENNEEIVKPEWMNKSKEEMSDEEKKLFKEFEKKMAIFKEEQEKHKKALETELRKLQSGISEIQDAYDTKLWSFFQHKLDTDAIIYEKELNMIKETQFAITSDNDEKLEARLKQRLEELKSEKNSCNDEMPEIRKQLEDCRDEHDIAIKKDKDLEKLFKKEFHVYDGHYDTLFRIFKRRSAAAEKEEKEEDINPFPSLDKDNSHSDQNSVPMPDGLGLEIWHKFIDFRDRKIVCEQEVHATTRNLKELQGLIQSVLEESDRIKAEIDQYTTDLAHFSEYRFRNVYNLECLIQFKQGQVEVPQAPIVTDYNDAILLHQSVVENLNEQVRNLGQLKVEALTEMKDYRKGIHALEWENKMHDFQAEDLIILSRDIQLLRVTKEMQEYLRNGENHKQASEVANLEKISEHSQKQHQHKIKEKEAIISKLRAKQRKKAEENKEMLKQIEQLTSSVEERSKVRGTTLTKAPQSDTTHKEIFTRRRLVDLAKSQAQDIAILREEHERLRLRTYPAFRAT